MQKKIILLNQKLSEKEKERGFNLSSSDILALTKLSVKNKSNIRTYVLESKKKSIEPHKSPQSKGKQVKEKHIDVMMQSK